MNYWSLKRMPLTLSFFSGILPKMCYSENMTSMVQVPAVLTLLHYCINWTILHQWSIAIPYTIFIPGGNRNGTLVWDDKSLDEIFWWIFCFVRTAISEFQRNCLFEIVLSTTIRLMSNRTSNNTVGNEFCCTCSLNIFLFEGSSWTCLRAKEWYKVYK